VRIGDFLRLRIAYPVAILKAEPKKGMPAAEIVFPASMSHHPDKNPNSKDISNKGERLLDSAAGGVLLRVVVTNDPVEKTRPGGG
jgi:hypothetical protein